MNLYILAGAHGYRERDTFEAGDEVEGALFWNGFEALRAVGADGQGPVWFCDLDGFGIGSRDCFVGARDDGKDELQRRLGGGICACDDFDGGSGQAIDEAIVGVAVRHWLMGGGEKAALGVEGDLVWGGGGGQGGFEVAEAGVGLFAREFDAWGEGHVGFVEMDLLVGDFDELVFGHAGGQDGT